MNRHGPDWRSCIFKLNSPFAPGRRKRNKVEPARIQSGIWTILYIPIEVTVSGLKTQRILIDPAARRRFIITPTVKLQSRFNIEFTTRPRVPAPIAGIGFRGDVAE